MSIQCCLGAQFCSFKVVNRGRGQVQRILHVQTFGAPIDEGTEVIESNGIGVVGSHGQDAAVGKACQATGVGYLELHQCLDKAVVVDGIAGILIDSGGLAEDDKGVDIGKRRTVGGSLVLDGGQEGEEEGVGVGHCGQWQREESRQQRWR